MFLLVPAYPGSPGQKAVKWLCVSLCVCLLAMVIRDIEHIEVDCFISKALPG